MEKTSATSLYKKTGYKKALKNTTERAINQAKYFFNSLYKSVKDRAENNEESNPTLQASVNNGKKVKILASKE